MKMLPMKVVLICFPPVQSRGGSGKLVASVYILFTDNLLREYERPEDNEHIKVVYFIANPFQERDVNDNDELVSSAFKENVQEIELEIICKEIYQTKLEGMTDFLNLVQSAQSHILKGES
jgi:hypothetical protein